MIKNKFLKYYNLLKFLGCCKEKHRKILTKYLDEQEINAICECILNVLYGNIKISASNKKKLAKYKKIFKKLLKSNKKGEKKQIIVQHGGFLNILIPALISGISSIISATIAHKKDE